MNMSKWLEYWDKYHALNSQIPIEDQLLQKQYENEMKDLVLHFNINIKKSCGDTEQNIRRSLAYLNNLGYICNKSINTAEEECIFRKIVDPLREITLMLIKKLVENNTI